LGNVLGKVYTKMPREAKIGTKLLLGAGIGTAAGSIASVGAAGLFVLKSLAAIGVGTGAGYLSRPVFEAAFGKKG
jgi:hypothetical protein